MANPTKLFLVPRTYLDDVENMLTTAPRPRTAKDQAAFAKACRIIEKTRRQEVVEYEAKTPATREKTRTRRG